MSVDKATVAKIADLARISVSEDRQEAWAESLSACLDWIEQLQEVDTDGVEPMSGGTDLEMVWRADAVTDGGYPEKVLKNAPEAQEGFYTVPKVVE